MVPVYAISVEEIPAVSTSCALDFVWGEIVAVLQLSELLRATALLSHGARMEPWFLRLGEHVSHPEHTTLVDWRAPSFGALWMWLLCSI